jgi:large subunit ribosomal protein L19e
LLLYVFYFVLLLLIPILQVSLKVQKRLSASIMKCGAKKVWLDPLESKEIGLASSRQGIRKLIKNGLVVCKPQVVHSHARHQRHMAAKAKGRHCGKY